MQHGKNGFTLVELLIASAIAAIVLVMVLSLYSTISNRNGASAKDRRHDAAADELLRVLSRDIRCAYLPEQTNEIPFRIMVDDDGILEMTLFSSELPAGATEYDDHVDRKVVWSLDPEAESGVRVKRRGTDPEGRVPPGEQFFGEAIRSLSVSAHDGRNSYERWPVEGVSGLPVLVRLDLEYESAREGRFRTRWVEVEVPAARTFRPPSPEKKDSGEAAL